MMRANFSRSVLLWIRLSRIRRKYEHASARSLRNFGLTPAQFDILAQVRADEGITQGNLAGQLLVTQGNVTQQLDKLERIGLLERRPAGRTNCLHLTTQGHARMAAVLPGHSTWNAAQFAGLTSDEQGQLLALLRKLDRTMP